MSGTTIRVPVKTVRSPGLAMSTVSPRRMTSMDLGIDPAGISIESSCSLTFYQSMYTLFVCSNVNSRLKHLSLSQRAGSVNLKCCSTPSFSWPHWLHRKAPIYSSGLTSVDLVTVPWIDMTLPRLRVLRSLTLLTPGRLYMPTEYHFESVTT